MKMRLREAQQREADERAAKGDHRTTSDVIRELTNRIINLRKQ